MAPAEARWTAGLLAVLVATAVAIAAAATTVLAPASAGSPSPTLPAERAPAEHEIPRLLSETGLYLPDGTVDPRNRPFAPQYPLWTDGADKSRWVRLPDGATIDVSDIDAWRFPPGTTFWKEFAWGGRRVETRMIRRELDGEWTFAAYLWNEQQTDAVLAPDAGVAGVFQIPGTSTARFHSIPGVADCRNCHGSSPAVVLGFNALQLSDDRDPLAPNAERLQPGDLTLAVLDAEGRLSPARPDLVRHPPRIREEDATARAAIGYLSGNCGGCHNDRGPLARLGLVLLHDVGAAADAPEPAVLTAVDEPGRWLVPGIATEHSRLVAPGDPERSALLFRMSSRRPSSQMPPLGTVVTDEEAVTLVRQWIEGLGTRAEL